MYDGLWLFRALFVSRILNGNLDSTGSQRREANLGEIRSLLSALHQSALTGGFLVSYWDMLITVNYSSLAQK